MEGEDFPEENFIVGEDHYHGAGDMLKGLHVSCLLSFRLRKDARREDAHNLLKFMYDSMTQRVDDAFSKVE